MSQSDEEFEQVKAVAEEHGALARTKLAQIAERANALGDTRMIQLAKELSSAISEYLLSLRELARLAQIK